MSRAAPAEEPAARHDTQGQVLTHPGFAVPVVVAAQREMSQEVEAAMKPNA